MCLGLSKALVPSHRASLLEGPCCIGILCRTVMGIYWLWSCLHEASTVPSCPHHNSGWGQINAVLKCWVSFCFQLPLFEPRLTCKNVYVDFVVNFISLSFLNPEFYNLLLSSTANCSKSETEITCSLCTDQIMTLTIFLLMFPNPSLALSASYRQKSLLPGKTNSL